MPSAPLLTAQPKRQISGFGDTCLCSHCLTCFIFYFLFFLVRGVFFERTYLGSLPATASSLLGVHGQSDLWLCLSKNNIKKIKKTLGRVRVTRTKHEHWFLSLLFIYFQFCFTET